LTTVLKVIDAGAARGSRSCVVDSFTSPSPSPSPSTSNVNVNVNVNVKRQTSNVNVKCQRPRYVTSRHVNGAPNTRLALVAHAEE
jgi:hypothetical protein